MQQYRFAPGDTSKTVDIFLPDSSSTTGAGLAGLVFNTASLACYYRNTATGTVTAITLATQTVAGAWSSGGFKELDATNAKGMYRFDIPNAVLASAGDGFIYFYGATNLAPTPVQISVGYVPANAVQLAGTNQTARDIGASVLVGDKTGFSLSNGSITAATFAADAIDSNALAASAVTEIQSGLSTLTQSQVTGGAYALNSASFSFNTALDFTTTQKTSLNSATPSVTVSDKTGFSLTAAYDAAKTAAQATKLLKYVQLMARTDAANATDRATELTEINADGGSGAGSWNPANVTYGQALQALGGMGSNVGNILDDTGLNGVVVASGSKTGYELTSAYDLYHADIQYTVDTANTQDEYTISWFKNGVRQTSGITVPTLQVIKRADGTDLIASTTPSQIASTGTYKHDATTTARLTAGEAAIAVVTATIDGSTRSFSKLIGRDSTA